MDNNVKGFGNIKFVEKNIGGGTDINNIKNFNDQNNIIINNKEDYDRLLDYHNKIVRDKNDNDNYVERLDNEKSTTVYRINNYPNTVDDIIFSNPLIYPKEYDMYHDYLNEKNINPINTQVVKTKSYINIDSANRELNSALNIDKYIDLIDNSLEFINQSNYFRIYLNNSLYKFNVNDYIILRGFKNYENYYENLNFFFENGSPTVLLDIFPNYINKIKYYDILIEIIGVKNDSSLIWKNIPLEIINGLQKTYLKNVNNSVRIAFDLPINFYSENNVDKTLISNCKISFLNLGNYPINLINAITPITSKNLSNYLIIKDVSTNYIDIFLTANLSLNNNINLDGYWSNNNFRTGKNIQIGKINGFIQGYPNPNSYTIYLNKTYKNIAELKIVSSEIPNVQENIISTTKNANINNTTDVNLKYIENANNKLYWQNINDFGIYSIELESGYYTYPELKIAIEKKVSNIKRNLIFKDTNLFEYNTMKVEFDEVSSKTSFNLFDLYNLPLCLDSINTTKINSTTIYTIRIRQPYHNLTIDDRIFITDSIDYFFIDKKYINSLEGHLVTNVINNFVYEIILININEIPDVGDTHGGANIKIKMFSIFRLYFNFKDTFGTLIGFKLSGLEYSITEYATSKNKYTITNLDPYYYNISTVLIINKNITPFDLINTYSQQTKRYVLLLINGFNLNNNPNGQSYFYKFLLNGKQNSYLYNTFVPTPIYINPPLRSLNSLNLTFINPDGGLVNFGSLNHSLTLEITTLNNLPENTNMSTFMSRI